MESNHQELFITRYFENVGTLEIFNWRIPSYRKVATFFEMDSFTRIFCRFDKNNLI